MKCPQYKTCNNCKYARYGRNKETDLFDIKCLAKRKSISLEKEFAAIYDVKPSDFEKS